MAIYYDFNFIIALLLALSACYLHYKQKNSLAVGFLFLSAFFLRLFVAHLDPFLHPWDERFHALVARNMMDDPFTPLLRKNVVVPYDKNVWCCNHVWLHKQPLFMWQMAISMKIFGISEYAIRYPSVLMGAIMVVLLYRIAFLITKNKTKAFIAALLLSFSNYHLELSGGLHGMDHNDIAFGFYVLASIWAYIEYLHDEKKYKWVLLIGLFAGCAILNKWLTGLLVYGCWGVNILIFFRKQFFKESLKLLLSLVVCCIVFMPWQLYILKAFPEEARYEYAYNSKHIFEAVEGHSGNIWYYVSNFSEYFGLLFVLIPVYILLALYKRDIKPSILAMHSAFFAILIFFSVVVQTKMPSYFFVVAPIGYFYIAVVMYHMFSLFPQKTKPITYSGSFILVFIFLFQPEKLMERHSDDDPERMKRIENTEVYKNLDSYIPENYNVVFNMNSFEDIDVMFYNNDLTAHHWSFSEEDMNILKSDSRKVAAFENHAEYNLPEYVYDYPGIYIIKKQLK